MDENLNAIHEIVRGIKRYVAGSLRTANFDVTKQGIVTEILGGNKYSVSIQGTVFTVPCCTEQVFEVNDNVLVLFVQNDPKRKYIIGRGG